jgi:hypothetical protein
MEFIVAFSRASVEKLGSLRALAILPRFCAAQ